MDWQEMPLGMIRQDKLLNALLAIWKTRYSLSNGPHQTEPLRMYELGFTEALDAMAQFSGISEHFEAGKAAHQHQVILKQRSQSQLLENQEQLLKLP